VVEVSFIFFALFEGVAEGLKMNKAEFARARIKLDKTQKQMAELLRSSVKAVQSYEQGWRAVPAHVERQMLFLLSMKANIKNQKACWIVRKCSRDKKLRCPAWEFNAGNFCWFINGTLCEGNAMRDWDMKMKMCRSCKVMSPLFK
jgi:hypothetical protein